MAREAHTDETFYNSDDWFDKVNEVTGTIRDIQLDEIFGEIDALVRKHRSTASNEVIAAIAWDAFCDSCEGWDIPTDERAFVSRYPEYS